MSREEILKKDSYVVDCIIKLRDGDNGLFTQNENGDVIAKLKNYAIIPREDYDKLINKISDSNVINNRCECKDHDPTSVLLCANCDGYCE